MLEHVVYDLPKDILSTLTPKDNTNDGPDQGALSTKETEQPSKQKSDNASVVGSKACSLCGVTFDTVEDQRSHIRSDLHGYNLKQRIKGATAVSEGDFEKLVGGMVALERRACLGANDIRSRRKSIRVGFF